MYYFNYEYRQRYKINANCESRKVTQTTVIQRSKSKISTICKDFEQWDFWKGIILRNNSNITQIC
jgi:hypothetical protein